MTQTQFWMFVVMFSIGAACLVAGLGGITETMVVRPDVSAWEFPTTRICLPLGVLFLVAPIANMMRRVYQLELEVKQLKADAADKKTPD